jgi:hypothetical protein
MLQVSCSQLDKGIAGIGSECQQLHSGKSLPQAEESSVLLFHVVFSAEFLLAVRYKSTQ